MQGAVLIESAPTKQVEQNSLNSNNWSFQDAVMSKIITKISQYKTIKEQYGKCYRGLLTGLNNAFIIDEKTRQEIISQDGASAELIKPIYEGKDLHKWHNPQLQKYLICTHNGYEGTPAVDIEQYQALKQYLAGFEPQLSKRYDKGNTPYNLRNCAYQPLFYQPKIIWGNLQNANKFSWDECGTIISAPACMLPSSKKSLLAILNSKVVWLYLTTICVVRNGGFIEVKPQYFEQIPIPPVEGKDNEVLKTLTDTMLSLNSQLQEKRSRFLRRLSENMPKVKITANLQTFDQLDFNSFCGELKKQKIKLSLKDQDEWEEYFNMYRQECLSLSKQIEMTDTEINLHVYQLYGLTYEEVLTIDPETTIKQEGYDQP